MMKYINPIAFKRLGRKRRCLRRVKPNIKQRFDQIIEMCTDYLIKKLSVNSCIDLILFADRHKMHRLARDSAVYIDTNFENVLTSDEFLEMSTGELAALLPLLIYNEMNESDVTNAILLWSKYKKSQRKPYVDQLIA